MDEEAQSVAAAVRQIFAKEPPPSNLSFLYFGLFDQVAGGGHLVGFYVAGGVATLHLKAVETGNLSYFPDNRFLTSQVLNMIAQLAATEPRVRDLLNYAVLFGAAGIIAKCVSRYLGLNVPVYTGFDSGDYSLVSP
jgi:hypothetical protein